MNVRELEKQMLEFLSLATKRGWYNPDSENVNKWESEKASDYYYDLEKSYRKAVREEAEADFKSWKESQ